MKTTLMESDHLLDAKIVDRMTGKHLQTILRHIRNGNLKATRSQGYLLKPEDVRDFIQQLPELSKPGRPKNQSIGKDSSNE